MEELNAYRKDFLSTVEVGSQINKTFNRSEFVETVMKELIESEEISDFTPCYYEGIIGTKGKRVEFDGYDYSDDDHTFSIITCRYSRQFESTEKLTKTEIEDMSERARRFIEESVAGTATNYIEESEMAYELAQFIYSIRGEIQRFRIFVLSDLEKSDRIKTLDIGTIFDKDVVLRLWDISNLYELDVAKKGFADIEISFQKFGVNGIPCLRTCEKTDDNDYDSYLCAIPGKLLSDLYEKYGSRLMESNVRSYLRTTTKTNKSIRGTILKEPKMFFAYNNGITTTATNVDVRMNNGALELIGITGLQIVNGGQTTVTLYTVGKSRDNPDLSSIFVPMKISVVDREKAVDIVPKISRSANTQNKVSESDFFSNSPFHRTLQSLSRSIRAPPLPGASYGTFWYYERTRGQYRQDYSRLTGTHAKKFISENPKSQMFTKTDVAKYRLSFAKCPYFVSKGAQHALTEFSKTVDPEHLERINENYYKETIAMAIIFKRLEKIIPEQPWYNQGYRAQLVTYTIARLVEYADSFGGAIDLIRIWNEQSVPKGLEVQLTYVSASVNEAIINGKEEANIGEWCKKPKCWEKVKKATFRECPDFRNYMVSQKSAKFQQKIATRDQRAHDLMYCLIEVVEMGSAYWEDAYNWGVEHELLNGFQKDLLRVAMNLDRKRPTEKQAKGILGTLTYLRESGYTK